MEVPMPTAEDLRSADGLILESEFDAMVEAETHVDDVQAVVRRREPSSATSAVDITATCSVCIRSCSWTFLCRRESDFGRSLRAGTQAVT